jgi:hypothetical protein
MVHLVRHLEDILLVVAVVGCHKHPVNRQQVT